MNTSSRLPLRLAFVLGVIGSVICGQAQPVPADLPDLFQPAPAPAALFAARMAVLGRPLAQARPVFVDLGLLTAAAPQGRFALNLSPERRVAAVVARKQSRAPDRFTIAGRLESGPTDSFILVVEHDVAVGTIRIAAAPRLFQLHFLGQGTHLICEMDEDRYPPCAGGVPAQPAAVPAAPAVRPASSPALPSAPFACQPLSTVFDTLIVYDPATRQAAGGTNAINALCQLAIDETNDAYDNSGVGARVRLVYRGEVTYTESGSFDTDLDRLTDGGDGQLDNVHTLRDTCRADFVSLWITNEAYCGKGWCKAGEDKAFTVVSWTCATGNYSYGHEMGHNQGCHHDRENASSDCAEYDFSYGWRWVGASGQTNRTIMAYPPGRRVQYFSNPDVTFDGGATGVAIGQNNQAHNAETINRRRGTCEGFRTTRFDVWVDFAFAGSEAGTFYDPYNTVGEGAAEISTGVGASEAPSLWLKAGSTTESVTVSKPMFFRACGGMVTITGSP